MLDFAVSRTRKCQFKFGCLGKDSRYPVCTVSGANGEMELLLNQYDTGINCQYRGTSERGCICACPTHHSIHNKHRWVKSVAEPVDEGSLERNQSAKENESVPKTVEEAVQILINQLPQKFKLTLANMDADEVGESVGCLVKYIQGAFDLAAGNKALVRSCSEETGSEVEHPEDASAVILSRLVMTLGKTLT